MCGAFLPWFLFLQGKIWFSFEVRAKEWKTTMVQDGELNTPTKRLHRVLQS